MSFCVASSDIPQSLVSISKYSHFALVPRPWKPLSPILAVSPDHACLFSFAPKPLALGSNITIASLHKLWRSTCCNAASKETSIAVVGSSKITDETLAEEIHLVRFSEPFQMFIDGYYVYTLIY